MSDEFHPFGQSDKINNDTASDNEPRGGVAENGVAADQLRSIVERIERLAEEKQAIADDIKAVYSEAKANGFDVKALRRVVALRKVDEAERQAQEAMLDLYMVALGMIPDVEA